ncbi:MAG: hypothetical protein OQK79_13755 [Rhodanobacter sp.]|nr:hypothetical protein [Rhodanobacter sp.]
MNSHRHSPLYRGALAYFALVFGAGFLLGMIRVPLVVPRIGERYAELAEMPLMFVAILFAARHVVRKYGVGVGPGALFVMGVLALLLLLSAELLLAVVVAGGGVIDYATGRDPVSGGVYIVMLIVFAAMPWLQAHGTNRRSSKSRKS